MFTMGTTYFLTLLLLGVASIINAENGPPPALPGFPMNPVPQSANAPLPILIKGPISISPRSHSPLFPFLGIFPGSQQCGGSGKLLTFRSEACIHSNPVNPSNPCAIPAGPVYSGEIAFVAMESFKGMSAVGTLNDVQSGQELFRTPPIWYDLAAEAGKEYEIRFDTATTQEYKGRLVRAQYLINRGSHDKGLELCAEAVYQVV